MKKLVLRLISLVGVFLGYAGVVEAQYGAPPAFFKVNAKVKTECGEIVKNPKITFKSLSDSSASFYDCHNCESDGIGNIWFYLRGPGYGSRKLQIVVSDPDSKNLHKDSVEYSWFYSWDEEDKDTICFTLFYKDNPPCNNEKPKVELQYRDTIFPGIISVRDDTIAEPELIITEADTITLKTGISKITNSSVTDDGIPEMSLFPVPAKNQLYIRLIVEKPQTGNLFWLDSNGKIILNERIKCSREDDLLLYNVSNLAAGTYFVFVLFDNNIKVFKKFIKT